MSAAARHATLRRLLLAPLAALALTAAVALVAPSTVAAQDATLKVGVVDFALALSQTEGDNGAIARLEADAEQRNKDLRSLEDDILAMEQEIKENSQVYSEDKLKEVFMAYRKKVAEYREAVYRNQVEFEEARAKILGGINRTMQEIAIEIAQEKDLDLMLERNEGAVLYFDNAFDLTDELVRRYQARTEN